MRWRADHYLLFLVVMMDGFGIAAIGFIAPAICDWAPPSADLALLFAGLLGLTAGALLCGPLPTNLGVNG